jgi:hypothetical protein
VNRIALRLGMLLNGGREWQRVRRMARGPEIAQRDALRRIVRANRATRFGTTHGFADITDPHTFRQRVPAHEYEALRPYIDEQRLTGKPVLTADPPLFYAQTSGTTAAPKYIPVTAATLAMHRREQALFSYLQFRACPAAFEGKGLGIMGAAVEGRLDSGHAIGSVSGHLYQMLPRAVLARAVIPPVVSTIADYDVKYRTILCLALAQPDITYLGTPNPSTFLRLLALMNAERDRLLEVVATGQLEIVEGVPPHVRAQLRVEPNRARAAALGRLEHLTYASVWPRIRLVTTWTGGSCGIAADALRRELPSQAQFMELGYQATECRGTIALEPGTQGGLPALHHHYFEFVEQSAWDEGRPAFLSLEELEERCRYYVLVTTAAGLYRYFMNDLLEVAGRFERTPLLRFVQKGKGVTSLTGEKLYEAQVIGAVQQAAAAVGLEPPTFFLMVADEERNRYELLIETSGGDAHAASLADAVDQHLSQINLEYHAKRDSGRLGPVAVTRLAAGSADAHRAAHVRAGQREAQFKPVILQYRKDLRWTPAEYVLS